MSSMTPRSGVGTCVMDVWTGSALQGRKARSASALDGEGSAFSENLRIQMMSLKWILNKEQLAEKETILKIFFLTSIMT